MLHVDTTIRLARRVEEVWALVSSPGNDDKWHHNVARSWQTSDGPIGLGSTFQWDSTFLGRHRVDVTITRWEPPRVAESTFRARGLSGGVSYTLEPDDGGTRLTRRFSMPWPKVLLPFAPIARVFMKRSGDHHAQDLVRHFASAHGHDHEHDH